MGVEALMMKCFGCQVAGSPEEPMQGCFKGMTLPYLALACWPPGPASGPPPRQLLQRHSSMYSRLHSRGLDSKGPQPNRKSSIFECLQDATLVYPQLLVLMTPTSCSLVFIMRPFSDASSTCLTSWFFEVHLYAAGP